ncbi:MAG: hypothetical protein ACD_34C00322G0006 [uncultured bacterium]|nr:MAG: hypothetical protein ACD_34C00322G0006 [uncultured bacterium]
MLGLGVTKLADGGRIFSFKARIVLSKPTAPAALFKCPIFDFTDPRAILPFARPYAPNTVFRLFTSATSPTFVEVPCPSINPTSCGVMPAFNKARSIARCCPKGFGAVIPFPFPSELPPIPRINAYILSPSRSASSKRFNKNITAPSPITNPSALSEYGRDPSALKAPIFENFMKDSGPMFLSTPPQRTASK